MQRNVLIVVLVTVLALGVAPVLAQSGSELLEKGVYLEETAGQLDQAIEIYRRIVRDATASRAHVAEALFRLGACHLQQEDAVAAAAAFERILADYSEQEPFATWAREQMPDTLNLLAAPWDDGEVLRLTLKLTSGVPSGAMLLTADTVERGGEELWRFRRWHKGFSSAIEQSMSRVLARGDDMTPVESVLRNAAAGRIEAEYGDGVARIETIGTGTRRELPLGGATFDRSEVWHLLRRLPLAVGFKKTIQVFSPEAGDAAEKLDVEVTGKETVTVPAGEQECYRLELRVDGNPQVFWYSSAASRTLVKFEAAGLVGELAEAYVQKPEENSVYRDIELGYSVSLPPDWLFQTHDFGGRRVLFLLDPEAETEAWMRAWRAQGEGENCFYQAAASGTAEEARMTLQDYSFRDDAWAEGELSGWPTVRLVGDYRDMDRRKVQYWTFIDNGDYCVDFTLQVGADRFEALRPEFDSIIASYKGAPPPAAGATASRVKKFRGRKSAAEFHAFMMELQRQKEVVVALRKTGAAFLSWLADQEDRGDALAAVPIAEEEPGWSVLARDSETRSSYFKISHTTLSGLLVPVYIDAVPERDSWDHPLQFAIQASPGDPVFSIRSAGRDGRFDTDDYEVGGFHFDEFDHDVVWCDGYFMRWPTADVPPSGP